MKLLLIILTIVNIPVLSYPQGDNNTNSMKALYFDSPENAIPVIKELLLASDWEELSRYYDLKNSEVRIESLLSGSFFIRNEKPEVAHPGGFWKYKHPFPPAFIYHSSMLINDNIFRIDMKIIIDQGDGKMQEGGTTFYMIKSDLGYRILPGSDYD
jgi:hypothetical protein